jgi:hypothetical protein
MIPNRMMMKKKMMKKKIPKLLRKELKPVKQMKAKARMPKRVKTLKVHQRM